MTDTLNRKTQHNQAMGYAQEAILAEQRGEQGEALQLYRKAFLIEKEVAMTFFNDLAKQPTRAVLFRSAAILAKNCGEIGEAIQLITYGKSGNPPASVVNELDQLYLDLTHSLPANSSKKN